MSAADETKEAIAIHHAAIAACAAGPWRTDVEDIEDDTLYIVDYDHAAEIRSGRFIKRDGAPFEQFAVYNPPEPKP